MADRHELAVILGDTEDPGAKDVRIAVTPLVTRKLAGVDAITREHFAERPDEEIERRLDVRFVRGAVSHGHAQEVTTA